MRVRKKLDLPPSASVLEAMNNLTGAARRVTRNLDQFSVICVFGSVVGCVLLPLMVQVGCLVFVPRFPRDRLGHLTIYLVVYVYVCLTFS